jgi:pimeloyl-ACP methyl ester carboxylesterase
MQYSSRYATCAGREIHYTEWGAEHRPTVIAWHGLARTGRDMDELAAHLCGRFRVICPDTLGRGFSQWSEDPQSEYTLAFYAKIAGELFDRLGIEEAHWVGTSMGGAIGTVCAGGLVQPQLKPSPRSTAFARMRATRRRSPPWRNSRLSTGRSTSRSAG